MLQRDEGRYLDTPQTALFLDRESPPYIGGLLEMANDRLYPFWASLTEALRTGQPQNEIKTGAPSCARGSMLVWRSRRASTGWDRKTPRCR
jgi:hypothetical protein